MSLLPAQTSSSLMSDAARTDAIAPPDSAVRDLSTPSPFAQFDWRLGIGDLAPDWVLETVDGKPFSLLHDSVAGSIRVLVLLERHHDWEKVIARFGREFESQMLRGIRMYFIVREAKMASDRPRTKSPLTLVDRSGAIAESVGGSTGQLTTVVLRSNHHIAGIYRFADSDDSLAGARALCDRLQDERAPTLMGMHPPVLTIPDVFSAAECEKLIGVYNTRGQVLVKSEKALDYFGADYKMDAPEHMREDRTDHFFFERATLDFLLRRLIRVEAEVAKAFQYKVTRHETLRIARYNGVRSGYGYGHRDNVSPNEHRRFALSVNLNAEQFKGGELRFPEFGAQLYRPETGSAFVFSSSLLHEATEVASGTRFVLLSFMF